ncbi:hypothetical protein MRX96_025862 [Rhipicephalus microplus]
MNHRHIGASRTSAEDFVEIPSDSDRFAGGDDFSDSDPEYEVNDKAIKTSKQRLEARKAISAVCESSDTESEQDDVPVMTAKVPVWSPSYKMSPPLDFLLCSGVPLSIQNVEKTSPYDIFSLFRTPSLMELLVFQTNLYAQQQGKPYTPTTFEEMRSFLGLNLLMGIKRSPSDRDYWSTAPDLHDPFISKVMPVNRFGWLLSHLHLNDNILQPARDHPNFDKLYKVRPLLTELSKTFAENYLPTELLAIDESMIKFKGRSSLKQYMPKKPVKRGYKVWMLCASRGYNLKFDIYTGKSENGVQKELGAQVVRKLCHDLVGQQHRVFFDNYFTSYNLLKDLLHDRIYACGTVNSSRKNLPCLQADKWRCHR